MSINSIDHGEITDIKGKYEIADEVVTDIAQSQKRTEARRRIEAMREIRESGLTLSEAKDLGLIH
ncbi:PA3496 family putative envelope integrity protein [Aliivibrio wodanis]|uniref:PA3496 family putative envelope integrity protein n=1 Tax=Aliivibrio wodanis TaxID=80852 RepID=UPI00406CE8E5